MTLNWANRITIIRILLIPPFVSLMLKSNDVALSYGAQNAMRYNKARSKMGATKGKQNWHKAVVIGILIERGKKQPPIRHAGA